MAAKNPHDDRQTILPLYTQDQNLGYGIRIEFDTTSFYPNSL